MIITNLSLENFRNYKYAQVPFSKALNVLYGDNGQGKTNILESIYLCSTGKSYKSNKNIEIILHGKSFFKICLELENEEYKKKIDIKTVENAKSISINDILCKKIGELVGVLKTVLFAPEDLYLVKGGPSNRRKFIDICLSQIKPNYFSQLQKFSKILKQRNSLLKEGRDLEKVKDQIFIWDLQLAEVEAYILKERNLFLCKLNEYLEKRHLYISNEKEKLEIRYINSFSFDDYDDLDFMKNKILDKHKESFNSDFKYNLTGYGPHRDDLEFLINSVSLKSYGSQGQQRSSVLSLKLAEIDIIRFYTETNPVLLLDDVMSELDEDRKLKLIECLDNIQTIITTTSKNILYGYNIDANYYKVVNGTISKD